MHIFQSVKTELQLGIKNLFPLLFAVFVSMLGMGIISPLLPIYAEMLGASGIAIGLIYGVFALARAAVMPYYGRLSDQKGRKIFITSGLAGYFLLSFAYIFANGVFALSVIRLFHGFASAAILPIVMAYVGDLTPANEEGKYIGFYNMSLFMGWGCGPILGGFINDRLGIHWAFIIMGIIIFFGLLLVILFVREPQKKIKVPKKYTFNQIISNQNLKSALIYNLVNAVGRSAIFAFLPILAHKKLTLSGTKIGFIISFFILITSLFQIPFGHLADKFPRKFLVILGAFINIACLISIIYSKSYWSMILTLFIMGIGGAIDMPALTAIVINEAKEFGMGTVMGYFNFAMSIGQSVGPIVAGYLIDLENINAPFYFSAILVFIGILLFIINIKHKDIKEIAQNNN